MGCWEHIWAGKGSCHSDQCAREHGHLQGHLEWHRPSFSRVASQILGLCQMPYGGEKVIICEDDTNIYIWKEKRIWNGSDFNPVATKGWKHPLGDKERWWWGPSLSSWRDFKNYPVPPPTPQHPPAAVRRGKKSLIIYWPVPRNYAENDAA